MIRSYSQWKLLFSLPLFVVIDMILFLSVLGVKNFIMRNSSFYGLLFEDVASSFRHLYIYRRYCKGSNDKTKLCVLFSMCIQVGSLVGRNFSCCAGSPLPTQIHGHPLSIFLWYYVLWEVKLDGPHWWAILYHDFFLVYNNDRTQGSERQSSNSYPSLYFTSS